MNWTKTPPTKPGAYWWRCREIDEKQVVNVIEIGVNRLLVANLHPILERAYLVPSEFGGEWCGPLVPAEIVREAFVEGVNTADKNYNADACWQDSLAKRKAEGVEP